MKCYQVKEWTVRSTAVYGSPIDRETDRNTPECFHYELFPYKMTKTVE